MATRRAFLFTSAASVAGVWAMARPVAAQSFEVTHTDAEWRKLLTPAQYAVLRHESTEQPFTSPLLNEKRRGTFACAGCGLDAFSSATKFDAGTGWPSFWAPLDKAIITRKDTSSGIVQEAVFCRRCGGHFGHVFNDGPKPTGLRYCMNGVALTFKATAS